jgi:hypothetical protein
MLMEVVDPEPLTGDHVPFRKETRKSEFMEHTQSGRIVNQMTEAAQRKKKSTRFTHWQDLPGGRPIQYLIMLVYC